MTTDAKHLTISRQLAAEIRSGKYPPGARLASEAQLLKRFSVSRPTVGRALRDLQELGLIERRAGSGTYVRQAPGTTSSPAAKNIIQLGLIVPSLRRTEIFESICGEIASLARVHDYGLWWGGSIQPIATETGMSPDEADALCTQYIERGVTGVFFAPFEHRPDCEGANQRITSRLRQAGISVVLLDRDICPFLQRSDFDLVGIDNFAGGYTLAKHLIKLGSRRLGYVTRPHTAPTVEARIAGARSAMLHHGIIADRDFVLIGDPADESFVQSFAADREVDAVMCTNDHVAAQLLQTLTRLRIKVPQQIRIVGFDDMSVASLLTVPLTTMAQPPRDLAITAFHAMRDRLTGTPIPARSLLLTPRLVVRESCGAYLRSNTTPR